MNLLVEPEIVIDEGDVKVPFFLTSTSRGSFSPTKNAILSSKRNIIQFIQICLKFVNF